MALALGASMVSARAFVTYVANGNPLRWNLAGRSYPATLVNPSTKAIRFYMASDAYSVGNREAELNAIRASFAQWQAIPGTALKFEEAGLAPASIDLNSADGMNVVLWATQSRTAARDSLFGQRAFTAVSIAADNSIQEADIVLNGIDFSWFTDYNNTISAAQFVESVVTHEIGHFLGLDHSPVGGSTVFPYGGGVGTDAGLSSDEIAAARYLYPDPAFAANLAGVKGKVLAGSAPVFGAAVIAESAAGTVVAGTVSRATGDYELPAMAPGAYRVRVCPLDPSSAAINYLFLASDISGDYENADTGFLPSANKDVTLTAGAAATLDFNVTLASPMRVAFISPPATVSDADSRVRTGISVRPGQSNVFVGVSSPSIPASGATLSITGDGLTVGPTISKPKRFPPDLNLLSVKISVAANATPGLRSFVVTAGNSVAYANGYLEVLPPYPDVNFDGLDDLFQRRYFPLYTAAQAAPGADPDGDGFSNQYEYETKTDPTRADSYSFKIESVKLTRLGGVVTWKSDVGKKYQLYSRPDLQAGSVWVPVGDPVTATATTTQATDRTTGGQLRFYKLMLAK